MTFSLRRLPVLALMMALTLSHLAAPAVAQQAPGGERPPAKAGFVILEEGEVPVILTLTGRAVATSTVQVRPRVNGTITAIHYQPGTRIEEGAPLFTIDPMTYEIAVAIAEANLARVKADLSTSETAFERADRLKGTASSAASVEVAAAALAKARASLGESEASLRLARAQLEWTTVRAPTSGTPGVALLSVGDLVTANQAAPLAEIVQTDPIHVDLTEPYPTRLRLEASAERGELRMTDPSLTLVLDDGRRIEGQARLLSTGANVSQTTGTRMMRFEVQNPQGVLAPGMFLQGELTLAAGPAILVPQRAAKRERDGTLTAWVAEDGKSVRKRLTERGTYLNAWVVIDGLEPGDQLLVDGIETMREGQTLELIAAEIDAMGVVRDANAQNIGN